MGLVSPAVGREIQEAQANQGECESVIAHGADPTGVADSTAAFDAARIAAGSGGAICVPVGDYLVDPDAFEWGNRLWIGDRAHGTTDNTRILARGAGTSLCSATQPIQLANLTVLANGFAITNVIFLNGADDSQVFNTGAFGGTNGFRIADVERVTLIGAGASSSVVGHLFENCHLRAYDLRATSNTSRGLEIVGTGDDTDDQFVGIYGCLMEFNTGNEQMRINGARAGELVGLYSEGGGDHLLIDGDTRNFNFAGLRFSGGGAPTVAIRISEGSLNTFTQCGAGGSPTEDFARVFIEGGSELNEFYAMHFGSGISAIPMTIEFDDGVGNYECIADNGVNFKGDAAPTRGNWRQGQIVFNNSPTGGSTLLWRCTVSGSPGTWEAVS